MSYMMKTLNFDRFLHNRLLEDFFTNPLNIENINIELPKGMESVVMNMKIRKVAILAFLAVLTVTMICSSVWADETVTPQSLLLELREKILTADDMLFRGVVVTNTRQLKNALANKINAVIKRYDDGQHDDAVTKLEHDIAPKLTDPHDADGHRRTQAKSWLYMYPEDCPEWRAVTSFAAECQGLIELIISLTDEGPID